MRVRSRATRHVRRVGGVLVVLNQSVAISGRGYVFRLFCGDCITGTLRLGTPGNTESDPGRIRLNVGYVCIQQNAVLSEHATFKTPTHVLCFPTAYGGASE